MAPKEKTQAKPPAAGKAAPANPALTGNEAIIATHKKICAICGVIVVLSVGTMVALYFRYLELQERLRPIDVPFKHLRKALATAIREPYLLISPPKAIADEVHQLPGKIENSGKLYDETRKQYRALFYTSLRTSSGPWKLFRMTRYYFSNGEKNWYEAENFCLSRDGHLASVLDDEEQNFISSHLQHTSWIGLTLEKEDGKWRWSDGSTVEKQYWSEGQPNKAKVFEKSNLDCAMMVPSLTYNNWKDNSCHKRYRWVCKHNLDFGEQ